MDWTGALGWIFIAVILLIAAIRYQFKSTSTSTKNIQNHNQPTTHNKISVKIVAQPSTYKRAERTPIMAIPLRCSGCGKNYILGENAIVVSMAGVSKDFLVAIDFSRAESHPDLIDALERGFNFLDAATAAKQRREIEGILSSLSSGERRQWRCRACNKVQTYSPSEQLPMPAQ
ncbi:hypothetical protein SBDP2_410009 [Syntrophobacter sp. SbD2]|nr:hypothetical protein SBDP2_410009 [Syntrophobacter sp. SbD2]